MSLLFQLGVFAFQIAGGVLNAVKQESQEGRGFMENEMQSGDEMGMKACEVRPQRARLLRSLLPPSLRFIFFSTIFLSSPSLSLFVEFVQFVASFILLKPILVPITADALFTVLGLILRIRPRPQGIVVPATGRLFGPVVGRQGKALFQPFAEADDDILSRPPHSDYANIQLGGNCHVDVRKIEGRHVAQNPATAVLAETVKGQAKFPARFELSV
jgi:hypothetical protein